MSNSTEQSFQWTNELVFEYTNNVLNDFAAKVNPISVDKFIRLKEQSKVKKEEPKQEWEILAYNNKFYLGSNFGGVRVKGKDGLFYFTEGTNTTPTREELLSSWTIHSVRSLPLYKDFSIDDITNHGRITGFKINGTQMLAEFEGGSRFCDLGELKKVSPAKQEQEPIKVVIESKNAEGLIGVRIIGNVVKYENSASIKITSGKVSAIAMDGIIFLPESDKTYTEKELLEAEQKAFEQSRLTHPMVGFKYDTFSDYKNSKK